MTARVSGWFLALWSAGFAFVHIAWAAGWRAGVPADAPPISDRPWFLAYDLLAGGLMLAAVPVALALAHGNTWPLLRRATIAGAILALARGLPALFLDITAGTYDGLSFGADVWFTVAGLAGLLLVRATPRPDRDVDGSLSDLRT